MNVISETVIAFGLVATIIVLFAQIAGVSVKTTIVLAVVAMLLFFLVPTALGMMQ